MISIATVLFTYNRPEHTEKVLSGLKSNTILPEKLYIFHDGLKANDTEESICKWEKVGRVIKDVNWCECEVITSDKNNGLSDSIVNGINRVLKEHDAVIVLEDDCVPQPGFMEYMRASLIKYAHSDRVFCINASDEPLPVPSNGADAYFMGRINSWGWGTWKDKWECFDRDYRIVGKIKKDKVISSWLDVWGQDLEAMLHTNITGATDSWAAFWALCVIANKGLCLAPYKSYIDNIGFDGTGRHCDQNKPASIINTKEHVDFVFPTEIDVIENYDKIFSLYYPWTDPMLREKYYKNVLIRWIDVMQQGGCVYDWFRINNVKKICLWGLGDIGKRLIREIDKYIEVKAIIESKSHNISYKRIEFISPDYIPDDIDMIIVIPGYDIKHIDCMVNDRIKKKLLPVDVIFDKPLPVFTNDISNVKFFGSEYGGFYVDIRLLKKATNIIYSFGIGEDLTFSDELNKQFDVEIWAFDPTPKSERYVKNHNLYLCENFHFFNYGLAGVTKIDNFYLPENEDFVSGSSHYHSGMKTEAISVHMYDLITLMKKNGHDHIDLLKMDIEGSEFEVIDNLDDKVQINQICVEIHDRFFENGWEKLIRMHDKLVEIGYILVAITDSKEELTYTKKR